MIGRLFTSLKISDIVFVFNCKGYVENSNNNYGFIIRTLHITWRIVLMILLTWVGHPSDIVLS